VNGAAGAGAGVDADSEDGRYAGSDVDPEVGATVDPVAGRDEKGESPESGSGWGRISDS
jgi:hypothetical protein